jgi:predicted phosphodiesterase
MLIAVLSDIHSNLGALDAVLASLGTVDAVWHLGDVVGYGPDPNAVVGRLREVGAIGVRGNHDAQRAAEWTRAHIDEATRTYLAALPELLAPEGTDFTLAHGSPRDPIWEYLDSASAARESLALIETRYCLVGHTHVPLVFREARGGLEGISVDPGSRLQLDGRRMIINPGSVGQPRDGCPDASYLILDTTAGHATWHRVAYDIAAVQAAILAAGLPGILAWRLSYGL